MNKQRPLDKELTEKQEQYIKPIDRQTYNQKISRSPFYGYRKPEQEEKGGQLFCRCTIPYLTNGVRTMAYCMRCHCDYYH